MKFPSYLLPIFVLLLGGIWMVIQVAEISDLENEVAHLKRRIKSPPLKSSASLERRTRKTPLEYVNVDWSLVAGEFSRGHGRYGIFKSSLKIEEQLRQLSGQELIKALHEIENGNLPDSEVESLTRRLLWLLVEKDPAFIVTRPSDDPRTASIYQNMQNPALAFWTKSSPGDAANWLDSQDFPPAQKFNLEHSLISSLMVSDFTLASSRLAKIPPQDRHHFFGNYNSFGRAWNIEDGDSQHLVNRYAKLTRLLPEDQTRWLIAPLTWLGDQDRPSGISQIQQSLNGWMEKRHGYLSHEVVHDYFQKIEPTSNEFHLCVEALVSEKRIQPTDQPELEGEALRTWLVSEFQTHISEE